MKKSGSKRRRNNHLRPEELQARRAAAHSGTLAIMSNLKALAADPEPKIVSCRPLAAVSPGEPWYARLPYFAKYSGKAHPTT